MLAKRAMFFGLSACLFAQSVIRVDTRLVQVDVLVRNSGGAVPNLTQQDFQLFENGKPRKISLFTVTRKTAPGGKAAPLAPGVVSNRLERSGAAPASATVILMDVLNTSRQGQYYANLEVMNFLKSMKDSDRVALYSLGRELRVLEEFTNDSARLKAVA